MQSNIFYTQIQSFSSIPFMLIYKNLIIIKVIIQVIISLLDTFL